MRRTSRENPIEPAATPETQGRATDSLGPPSARDPPPLPQRWTAPYSSVVRAAVSRRSEEAALAKPTDFLDVRAAAELLGKPLSEVLAGKTPTWLSFSDDAFHATSGMCNT